MSSDQQNIPPAGEEIHLPPGSLQPLALTLGLTILLVALTKWPWVSAIGGIIFLWALVLWIRDAVDEYRHLPADHGHDDHGHADEPVADEPVADKH